MQGNLADIKELVRKNLEQPSWCLRSTFQVLYKSLLLEAEQKGLTHLFRRYGLNVLMWTIHAH